MIVGIDEPSFADLELQWPWPRSVHARLVSELHRAGASVIAFDVVFADPTAEDEDRAFAEAIRATGEVVLAGDLEYQQHEMFEQVIRVDPLGLFLDAGASTGIASVSVDADMVVRQLPSADKAFWREIIRAWNRHGGAGSTGNPDLPGGSLIRYLPPGDAFTYASYYQALDPENMLPPGFFQGKIVLVGLKLKATPEPGGGADLFATPFYGFGGWLSPGIELVAAELADGLMDRSIQRAPVWAPPLLVLAMLLLVAPAMRQWRPLRSGLRLLILIVAVLATVTGLFAWRDYWFPAGTALLALSLYYLLRGAIAYVYERRRRRVIRRAFEHYVAPSVVKEILASSEQLELGGTRRRLTLMFTDLAGFTSLAERMEPEQVLEILNEHFSAMGAIIMESGGTIDKFIGDAVMAFWGAPLADEEQALHACQAAGEMQEAMQAHCASLRERNLPAISMRIGIHTGEAIVGNMGSAERFDYTAVGDSVNLAARMEGVNKYYGTEILISQDVVEELDGRLPAWPVDIIRVKGKSLPMEVYSFFADEALGGRVAAAVARFRQRDWPAALDAWRSLAAEPGCEKIAAIYVERTEQLIRQEPAPDWDGSFALEKM